MDKEEDREEIDGNNCKALACFGRGHPYCSGHTDLVVDDPSAKAGYRALLFPLSTPAWHSGLLRRRGTVRAVLASHEAAHGHFLLVHV